MKLVTSHYSRSTRLVLFLAWPAIAPAMLVIVAAAFVIAWPAILFSTVKVADPSGSDPRR